MQLFIDLSTYELRPLAVISRKPGEGGRMTRKAGTSGKMEKIRNCWQIEKSNGNREKKVRKDIYKPESLG